MRATEEQTWMAMADAAALRSACTRDQVGAVVIDASGRFRASGYNGVPSGFPAACPRCMGGPKASCLAIHAEVNALLHCSREDRLGGVVAVTRTPCRSCALIVANSGVARVVYRVTTDDLNHYEETAFLLRACGVEVTAFDVP